MLRPTLLGLLALLPLAVVPAASLVATSQGPDLGKLVQEELAKAGERPDEDLWRKVRSLADLARKLEGSDLAAAVEPALDDAKKLPAGAQLLAVGLRLQASDPDMGKLAGVLTPLLASEDASVALAAAQLSADRQFKTVGEEERTPLLAALSKLADDGARSPELRLESAIGLHTLGGGEQIRDAWRLMNSFLTSQDPELRQLGALALARTRAEITGILRDELRRMAKVPGERGRLADSYLEAARIEEYNESRRQRMAEAFEAKKTEQWPTGDAEDYEGLFRTVLQVVQQGHLEGDKVKKEELVGAALNGMLHSMDEHSSYMEPKMFSRFEQELEAGYGGIGAYVQVDPNDNLFTITRPIYSGPAYKAELMSEDKIVRVDDWPTLGKDAEEVIKRLKGRPGTKVRLYIWRRGMDAGLIDRPTEEMAVEVERASIQIPAVQWQMLPGKVGLVSLLDFSRVAQKELRPALISLMEQGMESLILDLRGNPGGLLDEAVDVASLFVPKGTLVVRTESRVEESERHVTDRQPLLPAEMPMAVLINRFSASASEIVAGALQDEQRATLVGQRSFGKGSVQKILTVPGFKNDAYVDENGNGRHDNWEPLTNDWNKNGEFDFAPHVKLTIARYLLPSGRSIHRELDKEGNVTNPGGVDVDVKVDPRTFDSWRVGEMLRLRDSRKVVEYVRSQFDAHKDLFLELAVNDQRDPKRYPGFDAFFQSLDTPLDPDDVRQLVRFEVRRRVQDVLGKEFPSGDFVEDEQLQEAIRIVLEKRGQSATEIEEYRAAIPPRPSGPLKVAKGEEQTVKKALDEIAAAQRGDGKLSADVLSELHALLQASLEKNR